MAKAVVAALELVDVDEGHRERLALLPQGLHGALVEPAVAHAGERVGVGAVLELGVAALDLADHAVEHGDVLALALELGGLVCLDEARAQGQELREALAHVLEAGDEGVGAVRVLRADGLEVAAGEVLGEHAALLDARAQVGEALSQLAEVARKLACVELRVVWVLEQRVYVGE